MAELQIDYKRLAEKLSKLKASFQNTLTLKKSQSNVFEKQNKGVRRLVEVKKVH